MYSDCWSSGEFFNPKKLTPWLPSTLCHGTHGQLGGFAIHDGHHGDDLFLHGFETKLLGGTTILTYTNHNHKDNNHNQQPQPTTTTTTTTTTTNNQTNNHNQQSNQQLQLCFSIFSCFGDVCGFRQHKSSSKMLFLGAGFGTVQHV